MTADRTVDELSCPTGPTCPASGSGAGAASRTSSAWPPRTSAPATTSASRSVIDLEGMTRTYSHLDHCDLSHGPRHRRARWPDDRLSPRRVEGPDQRVAASSSRSGSWTRPSGARASVGPCSAGPRSGSARSRPRSRTIDPAQLFAYTRDRDHGARVLFERNGWHPVARGYDMVRPTMDDIPDSPLPDGLVVRPSPRPSGGRSGRPRAKRSATTATSRSGPRRTGRRSRATSRT